MQVIKVVLLKCQWHHAVSVALFGHDRFPWKLWWGGGGNCVKLSDWDQSQQVACPSTWRLTQWTICHNTVCYCVIVSCCWFPGRNITAKLFWIYRVWVKHDVKRNDLVECLSLGKVFRQWIDQNRTFIKCKLWHITAVKRCTYACFSILKEVG